MDTKFTISFVVDGHLRSYSIDCVDGQFYLLRYRNVVQAVFVDLSSAFMALVSDFKIRFGDYEQGVISNG